MFAAVFALNASKFMLLHNHPSGNSTPSDADIQATKKIYSLAEQLRRPLIDHRIVAICDGTRTISSMKQSMMGWVND